MARLRDLQQLWRHLGKGVMTMGDGTDYQLQGVDLLGLDFSGWNFCFINFNRALLRDADLSHTNLSHASFVHADLEGADLSFACLAGTNLRSANLKDANFFGVTLQYLNPKDLAGTNLNSAHHICSALVSPIHLVIAIRTPKGNIYYEPGYQRTNLWGLLHSVYDHHRFSRLTLRYFLFALYAEFATL